MSVRYSGGIISKNRKTANTTSASGVWTVNEMNYWKSQSKWPRAPTTYNAPVGYSSWTAPAGVTSVSITATGQSGQSGYWTNSVAYNYIINIFYNYPISQYKTDLFPVQNLTLDSANSNDTDTTITGPYGAGIYSVTKIIADRATVLQNAGATSMATATTAGGGVGGAFRFMEYFPNCLGNGPTLTYSPNYYGNQYRYYVNSNVAYDETLAGSSQTLINRATTTYSGAYTSKSAYSTGIYTFVPGTNAGSAYFQAQNYGYLSWAGGTGGQYDGTATGTAVTAGTTSTQTTQVDPGVTYYMYNYNTMTLRY